MDDKHKKTWVTPTIKRITGFNVHENVVATSEIILPTAPQNPDGGTDIPD